MGPTKLKTLNAIERRIEIAKSRGWEFTPERDYVVFRNPASCAVRSTVMRYFPNSSEEEICDRLDFGGVPRYLTDLNAMHEIEKEMHDAKNGSYWNSYSRALESVVCAPMGTDPIHADATQRADAYLMTLMYAPQKKNNPSVPR